LTRSRSIMYRSIRRTRLFLLSFLRRGTKGGTAPLTQLTNNSNETNLRLGNVSELRKFLSSLPVRLAAVCGVRLTLVIRVYAYSYDA